jgi:hypothetical protein
MANIIPDINWLFAAPKLKQSVRVGLAKSEPASHAEVLKQPIFSNPLTLNTTDLPLGLCGFNEGHTIANSGYTRIKSLGPRGQGMKKPPGPLDDIPHHQQEQQRNHHSEYPMKSCNLH